MQIVRIISIDTKYSNEQHITKVSVLTNSNQKRYSTASLIKKHYNQYLWDAADWIFWLLLMFLHLLFSTGRLNRKFTVLVSYMGLWVYLVFNCSLPWDGVRTWPWFQLQQ